MFSIVLKISSYWRKREGTTWSLLIKNYFLKEREEETGDPAEGMFLDFILEK
jgi:hypothetical protein